MSRDRRPPGSRSPFENIGRSLGKREREIFDIKFDSATVTNAVAPPDSSWRDKTATEVMRDMEKVIREMTEKAIFGDFTVTLNGEDIGRSKVRFVTPNLDGSRRHSDPERERLEAEERRLREPIAKYLLKAAPGVAWNDVIGNDTARTHLVEAIEHPVRHAELYRHYGKKPTKGVLLYGPPGCGKTMFGKAAASTLAALHGAKSASFMSIKAPELQSGWVGETERTIRDIFAYARAYKALHAHPLVVFIDEADAILPSRDGGATWFQASNVATFLTEMDGIEDSGALVILATNRPDAIDAAILRDGRCDRKIRVERPTRGAAGMILQRALLKVPLAPETLTAFGEPTLGEMSGSGEPYMPTLQEHALGELAHHVAQAVFASEQIIVQLATDQGPRFIRLSDIVNGAMLIGIVEQAKGNAFRRDLTAGGKPTGLTRQDLDQAVLAVVAQNRGLNHTGVLQEIATREGFSVAKVIPEGAGPPRYTVDADDNVVRLQ
ncbi:SpoVK/Ycf46/Vps4 family AAA+-type ATPase [Methylobacterium sp. PvP062]|uniref:SpoVK/Ycf46/Vps4 family AAA+-type ATPase n=1 Tax=Methylobacterium radiotolerans TaxID=31998 RepID=A0ABV2NPD2_9HYPH|nr:MULTISPECIES: AAA family ATPase [unclassified Methylobacterium]MBP2494969.1 SpoVK/Ycf46/Vps4 family AAA+-type ATPase [Methylobacterium sp. PvP105]MBP2505160.1 SpoVK/Ycf46/Vps4 family AAA+-type ATPase [Methylobacterium sp. PvP109]MCX7336514.1 AAA family ATPase [Hyphomicrobiales bacterium]